MTSARNSILAALFVTAFGNFTLFSKLLSWSGASGADAISVASLFFVQFLLLVFLFSLFTAHRAHRHVLATLLLVTAIAAYFVDSYGVIINREMLVNVIESNQAEAVELVTLKMLGYLVLLFVVPVIMLYRVPVMRQSASRRLVSHLGVSLAAVVLIAMVALPLSAFYASFFREHKEIRVYSNPMASIYAAMQLVRKDYLKTEHELQVIGEDAAIPDSDTDRELVIVVVGETARADHFSLNGYERNTNPRLAQRNIVSFTSATSCGTSTAVSVPCMFAIEDRDHFDNSEAIYHENTLDVLRHAGVNVLWRDNNSSSKGVANRVAYDDFRLPEVNPVCDPECRDVGMLDGLDRYIDAHKEGDILIVLHQMGSHGPAYYLRVPDSFQHFRPTCDTNEMDECDVEQIRNSYDNTILYTDYFLDQVIGMLEKYDGPFETAMLYISDHGESLGESGLYLHGMPYWMAPDAQTHVPLIAWYGRHDDEMDIGLLQAIRDLPVSQDNVSHTMLGMFEISSAVYRPEMDLNRLAAINHKAR